MTDKNPTIEIYTSQHCGYCHGAKSLLKAKGLEYIEIDVTFDDEKRKLMMERSKQRTVPQIFIDGESIGGFRELSQLLAQTLAG